VAIVALANATPNGAAEAVTATFTDIVRTGTTELDWLAAYGGSFKAGYFTNPSKVAATPPTSPAPARPRVGDRVPRHPHHESRSPGPLRPAQALRRRHVLVAASGGNADPLSAVTFGGTAGGPATTMTIELLQFPALTRK
jgi:hypothetical protein